MFFKTILALTLTLPAFGGSIIYLTNTANQIFSINSDTPGTASSPVAISGLIGGDSIIGIDFRPATGGLYGLGSGSRLYTIDPVTGVATQVGVPGTFTLLGTSFGFDFNPTNDRIRVTSDADQNMVLNPNDATVTIQTPLNPGDPNIVGSAYSNNFNGAVTTTLYGIDYATNSLYTQVPATGTLTLIGPLGFDPTSLVAFDISSDGFAFAALQLISVGFIGDATGLYSINLASGAATPLGQIGSGDNITGLAIAAVPEPATFGLIGVGTAALLYFARRRVRKP